MHHDYAQVEIPSDPFRSLPIPSDPFRPLPTPSESFRSPLNPSRVLLDPSESLPIPSDPVRRAGRGRHQPAPGARGARRGSRTPNPISQELASEHSRSPLSSQTGCLLSVGFAKIGGGSGGYARYVAICPNSSPHGITVAEAPGAPLPRQVPRPPQHSPRAHPPHHAKPARLNPYPPTTYS